MNEDKIERLAKLVRKQNALANDLKFFRDSVAGDEEISRDIRSSVCRELKQAETKLRKGILSMLEAVETAGLGGAAGKMQQTFEQLAREQDSEEEE